MYTVVGKVNCKDGSYAYRVLDKMGDHYNISLGCLQEIAKLNCVKGVSYDEKLKKLKQENDSKIKVYRTSELKCIDDSMVLGDCYDKYCDNPKYELTRLAFELKAYDKIKSVLEDKIYAEYDLYELIALYRLYVAMANEIKELLERKGFNCDATITESFSLDNIMYTFVDLSKPSIHINLYFSIKHDDCGEHIYTNIRLDKRAEIAESDVKDLAGKLEVIKKYIMKKYNTSTSYGINLVRESCV